MVRLALAPLVAVADELLALRVCDPAIGEGAFLVEIVRVLAEALGRPRCARARRRALHRRRRYRSACGRRGARCGRESSSARRCPRCASSCASAMRSRSTGAAVRCARRESAVRAAGAAREQGARCARSRAYDGVADLYVYFVELAHRIGGRRRYCLVVPNKWMTAAYGRPLRELLARAQQRRGHRRFRAAALFGDADAFPCIVWGTSGGATTPIARGARRAADASPSALDERRRSRRARWRASRGTSTTPDDAAAARSPRARCRTLGDVVPGRPSRGVVTGCNRAFVIDGATRAQLARRRARARR